MPAMLVSRRWLATRRVDGGDAVSKVGISLWNVHLPTKKKKLGGGGTNERQNEGATSTVGGGYLHTKYLVPKKKN